MPGITRTAVENRIKEAEPTIRPSELRRAAKLHLRRFNSYTTLPSHEEALLLVKAITYQDETGDLATGIRRAA